MATMVARSCRRLPRYASDNIVMRYAKIALKLPGKTMIDVALRVRWMKVNAANQQVKPSSPSTDCSTSTDISYEVVVAAEIKGKSGQLFEENFQAINQISANFTPLKIEIVNDSRFVMITVEVH
ncbi:hypothetical protein L1987_72373 [Smallanthus sonchifolius]|uniref:Uncharacterized protein n=1 Tax=Smallanthus sonchifolius TaxID=185202 RepID=A0ACB9AVB7_9ASTR|nr:hypothetical protein L1987_72373 [Smallanthus sonchifolius]